MQLKPNTTLHPNCPQTEAESLTLLGISSESTDETDSSKVEDKPTPPTPTPPKKKKTNYIGEMPLMPSKD